MESTITPEPTKTPKPRRWPWIAGIVAAFLVGTGIGAAGDSTEPVAAEPEVITETVTETVEVVVTPDACLDIYYNADELDDHYRIFMGRTAEMPFSEAMDGILAFDTGPIENLTEWFIDMTDWMNDDWGPERDRLWASVVTSAEECEAS